MPEKNFYDFKAKSHWTAGITQVLHLRLVGLGLSTFTNLAALAPSQVRSDRHAQQQLHIAFRA